MKIDCPNCGGDSFSVEGGDCRACKGTGKVESFSTFFRDRVLVVRVGEKSQGQRDYERSVANEPNYHDGTPRKRWEQLRPFERDSWERIPKRKE